MKRLVLLGAGHAQLAVLDAFARQRPAGAEVHLVTPQARTLYSGLVPACIAGRCREAELSIDAAPLAHAAGAALHLTRAKAIDAAAQTVALADGTTLRYDALSINVGGAQDRDRIPGAREHALFVRPIEGFLALWRETLTIASERPLAVVVVGNGAAGFELAMAARTALGERASVAIVSDGPLLPGYPERVRHLALAAMQRRRVQLLPGRVSTIERWHVVVDGRMRVACDVPIVATGSDAPAWLQGSGLALDAAGFVRTGPTLQSPSHPNVFAAGDAAVRDDAPHPRSGVYAVRAGPPLATNLRAFATGGTLVPFAPQQRSLNLLAEGDGRAIASRGHWAAEGRLVGWWKGRIDRVFVARWVGRG
jgi:pyridine nucleotide-disulfide oxidoreductase family protein